MGQVCEGSLRSLRDDRTSFSDNFDAPFYSSLFVAGDLAYIDEDHFIFIVDRLKELIKVKGFQVGN